MDLSRLGQISQTGSDRDSSSGAGGAEEASSSSTIPKLICQRNSSTAIYRHKDEGIKVLVDPNPSEEQILKLMHEHAVSQFLPPHCQKRRVIDVKGFKGEPALYFEWARGVTLTEWLHEARARTPEQRVVDCLRARLRAAIAIVETLRDFHDAGVVYNNLSPDSIILDTFEGSYVATFIDLSEATMFHKKDEEFAWMVGEIDLKCLGLLLNDLFHCGDDCSDEEEEEEKEEDRNVAGNASEERKEDPSARRKRGKRQSPSEGLPVYLRTLISTLLEDGGSARSSSYQTRYERAEDLLLDLRAVEENPETFLEPLVLDVFLTRGRLRLPRDMAFGRQCEISMLSHALTSVTKSEGQPMMVSISGPPGTGKTMLVNQIKEPLHNAGGYFVSGKFDVRARSEVIFSALDSFYSDIMRDGNADIQREMRSRILKSVGLGCNVLMKSIPSLQSFMGENCIESTDTSFRPPARNQRWKYLLCKLVASTSSKGCPLVIFLDDLQWADETSLDVIRMIVTDPDIRYCLFVGVHRENLSSATQWLKKLLNGIQEQGVNLMSMRIGPIEKESVNAIVSQILCLPSRLCHSLSTTIHNKTGGIVLFVMNFLESLSEEGLLWFDLSSRRWEFDIRGIELKEISDDVVEYMSERMTRLPQEMQSGLKLSACLGSRFDAYTLQKATRENNGDVDEFLRFAVEGGYLQNPSPGKYMWAHDQIQQAAYELVPEGKRDSFHLLLGSRMFLRTPIAELDDDIFTIVGNMNIGVHLMKSQQQKLEVARLNLRAGEMAIASSSFSSATKYLMLGISLLPDLSWEEDYGLTMKLYDAATQANYVIGDFDTLSTIIETPLVHASCFEDKLNTYHILVRYLIASSQFREAVAKCRNILPQIGEVIPEDVDSTVYMKEVKCVKQSLIDLSEDDLLGLPLMTDERKLACMQFMNLALMAAYYIVPRFAPILVFRMVRLSIDHGVCNISPFAFSLYGSWLVSPINSDFEGGYRMGHLAITLMNRLDAKEFIPRVHIGVYGFINFWKEPFQATLAKLLEGYEAGALSGDIEYAVGCLSRYVLCALYNCGEDLVMLEKNVRLYIRRSIQCNQYMPAKILVVLHELILILIGSTEKSYAILATEYQQSSYYSQFILLKRKVIAFFNGDMDEAGKLFETGAESYNDTTPLPSHFLLGKLLDGLIAFFFARMHKEDETRWRNIGETTIDLARQWARYSNWNMINKLHLLEAEYYFLENDETKALAKYEQSIEAAHAHHFIHEEGLAFERAAWFHLHYGRNAKALVCFAQSKKCYENWGAHGLLSYIEKAMASCCPPQKGTG